VSAWILEMRPKEWDVDKYVRAVGRGTADPKIAWPVDEHADEIAEGDRIYLWRAGDHKVEGIIAIARVTGAVKDREADQDEYRKAAFEEQYAARRPRALLQIESVLSKPLYRVKLEWTEETKNLKVIGAKEGSAFAVGKAQDKALEKLCEPLAQAVS
jgi:hypothetical protein